MLEENGFMKTTSSKQSKRYAVRKHTEFDFMIHDTVIGHTFGSFRLKAEAQAEADRLNNPAPFSGGPGSAATYNSAWQCSPRCEGTKDNRCMIAVNRSKGGQ